MGRQHTTFDGQQQGWFATDGAGAMFHEGPPRSPRLGLVAAIAVTVAVHVAGALAIPPQTLLLPAVTDPSAHDAVARVEVTIDDVTPDDPATSASAEADLGS